MAKTEQNLLSINATMTAEDLQDAVDLENANFVQVIFQQDLLLSIISTLAPSVVRYIDDFLSPP